MSTEPVLILKEMQERRGIGETREHKRRQMITQRRRGREGVPEIARVSCRFVSGTGSLRRLVPRVQKSDRDTPPRVFLQKSRQAIENKRRKCAKERKERKRVRKRLKTKSHVG